MRLRAACRWMLLTASLALAVPRPAAALGPYCAAHPFNPLCCPSPCPVFDQLKLGQFLGETQKILEGVDQCRQTVEQYAKIATAFGPRGPLATELKHLPGKATAVLNSFRTDLPASVKAGDLANPRAVAEILKNALIDPDQLAIHKVTADGVRLAEQVKAAKGEAITALADAYHAYATLAAAFADHQDAQHRAAAARDLRSDVTANSAARRGLAESLGGLQEVLASWAAVEATGAIRDGSRSLGGLPSSPVPNDSALAGETSGRARQLEQGRTLRAGLSALDEALSGLLDLHNQRHAATLMRAQYPALRNSLDSYQAALTFQARDAETLIAGLSGLFTDGSSAFAAIAGQLRALDTTDWRDNAKAAAAAQAAAQVAEDIAGDPERFGRSQVGDPALRQQAARQMTDGFAAWLEDDKLERYWRPLEREAAATLASLDGRSAELAARFGFDPAGPDAPARETALLAQVDSLRDGMAAADLSGLAAGQTTELAAYLGAFAGAADAVRADPGAEKFIMVRWPQ